jgi:hypothetical protein
VKFWMRAAHIAVGHFWVSRKSVHGWLHFSIGVNKITFTLAPYKHTTSGM